MKSFTLIEILIVIAILGILAGALLVNLGQNPLKKARDVQRLGNMYEIEKALSFYLVDNISWPEGGGSGCGGWMESKNGNFIPWLQNIKYFSFVPVDPINNGDCASGFNYRFYVYPASFAGCDSSKGKFYVLGINDMETSGNPHPNSPGWICPSRNWQDEFDWVTGAFEN